VYSLQDINTYLWPSNKFKCSKGYLIGIGPWNCLWAGYLVECDKDLDKELDRVSGEEIVVKMKMRHLREYRLNVLQSIGYLIRNKDSLAHMDEMSNNLTINVPVPKKHRFVVCAQSANGIKDLHVGYYKHDDDAHIVYSLCTLREFRIYSRRSSQ
jgi:hypothetical protein